jgi:apolipoprotein D and lipocalin family protein
MNPHPDRPRCGARGGAWRPALVALALGAGGAGVAAAAHIPLARDVDLSRMYGGWHIVATIPNAFERGMVGPYDVYSPRPDGSIREDFYVRRGSFSAPLRHFVVRDFVKPGTGGAYWQVQIFWPLRLPFLVLYVDPASRYVIFGEDSRNLGWIYARDPKLSDAAYKEAFDRLAALGYGNDGVRPGAGGGPGAGQNGGAPGHP